MTDRTEYKRDWQFEKRHPEVLVPVEVTDPRAKENCVLCGKHIFTTLYLQNGNFCISCNQECGSLAKIFPMEYITMSEEQQEEYEEKLVFYQRQSKRFQTKILSSKKRFFNR